MTLLSQRDPAWAQTLLGSSKCTVGRYGCTTTSISMLSDYFGSFVTPKELASSVLKYTTDGLILWPSVDNIKHMRFNQRIYKRDDAVIQACLKDPNLACILQVNHGQHWVVALRKTLFGNSYIVADPWSGDKCDVISRYHNITGIATFSRK